MLFHQPQKRVTIPKLKINNTLIECVDECVDECGTNYK